jgi:hypothetical protein
LGNTNAHKQTYLNPHVSKEVVAKMSTVYIGNPMLLVQHWSDDGDGGGDGGGGAGDGMRGANSKDTTHGDTSGSSEDTNSGDLGSGGNGGNNGHNEGGSRRSVGSIAVPLIIADALEKGRMVTNCTDNAKGSWVSVDLGPGRTLLLQHYCIRHGTDVKDGRLRNWQLQVGERLTAALKV